MWKNFLIYLTNGNINHTVGNGNISLQGVEGSIININQIDEFIKELKKHYPLNNSILYLIVVKNFQNENPSEWKPFKDKNILEIIQSSTTNLKNVDVLILFLDAQQELNLNDKAFLNHINKNAILILDTTNKLEHKLFDSFNHYHIGGCIAVPSKKKEEYGNFMDILVATRHDETHLHQQKKTFKFAFKNVHSDWDIMENINNIATAYMGLDIDDKKTLQGLSPNIKKEALNNIPNI